MRISPVYADRQNPSGIVQRDHVHLDPRQHQPDRARLVRSLLGMRGAGRAGLGHAPAALQLHADPALEDPGDLDRQRRTARSDAHQRRQVALVEVGQARDRDPHGGNAGKIGGALDLDVAHHGFDIKTLVQRDQMAAPQAAQQHHGQREDVKQRQHADHALDRVVALGARRPAPDVVDRHRRSQIAVAEHRALRQAGGAAGILQQRDIVGVKLRPCRRLAGAVGELFEGDDRRGCPGSACADCRPRPSRRPGRRSAGRPGPFREISAPSAAASRDRW